MERRTIPIITLDSDSEPETHQQSVGAFPWTTCSPGYSKFTPVDVQKLSNQGWRCAEEIKHLEAEIHQGLLSSQEAGHRGRDILEEEKRSQLNHAIQTNKSQKLLAFQQDVQQSLRCVHSLKLRHEIECLSLQRDALAQQLLLLQPEDGPAGRSVTEAAAREAEERERQLNSRLQSMHQELSYLRQIELYFRKTVEGIGGTRIVTAQRIEDSQRKLDDVRRTRRQHSAAHNAIQCERFRKLMALNKQAAKLKYIKSMALIVEEEQAAVTWLTNLSL